MLLEVDTIDSISKNSFVFKLNEICCQKESWMREASIWFSKMNVGTKLRKQIAEKHLEFKKVGASDVLCSTDDECSTINNEIRSLKKERGEIGEDFVNL